MILQRLVDYYDRISADAATASVLPKPGYSLQKISFCVVLKPDGSSPDFQPLSDEVRKKQVARQMLVPGQGKPPGTGINPCFLWDNSAYMLGYKPDDPNPGRSRETFEAFRKQHLEDAAHIDSPAYAAVCAFLRSWSPEQAAGRAADLEKIVGNFGVFRIAGAHGYVHDDPAVIAYWSRQQAGGGGNAATAMCLVTGRDEVPARLHEPKIKGVVGTQSAGALLVSFNGDPYESFGKAQGDNAPVGETATFQYTNALNYLLGRQDRRFSLGDATVVFWAEQPTPLEDVADAAWGGLPPPKPDAPPEDVARARQVRLFLSQLRAGQQTGGDPISDKEDQVGFYVLGLSPNASRISVRFWEQSTVGAMKQRLAEHLRDTEIAGGRPEDPPLSIRLMVLATGRAEFTGGRFKGYDADSVPPLLAGAVARAVVTGGRYPVMLLWATLNRLRADGLVSHARAATIKACICRDARLSRDARQFSDPSREVSVALDTSRADPGYVTGRLFALLEKIQADSAGGDINATIKDRYFSSASATPGVVFPRLIRLSQHHLAKMETGQKVYYERQLGEVMGKLQSFPGHLVLEEQGLFAIGYFHQRQDLFTKRVKDDDDAKDADNKGTETKARKKKVNDKQEGDDQ